MPNLLSTIYKKANMDTVLYTLPSQTYALFLSCCYKVLYNPLTILKDKVEFILTYNNFIDFILENMQGTMDVTYRFLTYTDTFMYKHAVGVKKLLNSIDKVKLKYENKEITEQQLNSTIEYLATEYSDLFMSMQVLYIEFLKSVALIQESYIRLCRKANKDFMPPKITPVLGDTLLFLAQHSIDIKDLKIGILSEQNLEQLLTTKDITILHESARQGVISMGCMHNGQCVASTYNVVLQSSLRNINLRDYIKCLHSDYTCYIALSNYLTSLQQKYPNTIWILSPYIYEERVKLSDK